MISIPLEPVLVWMMVFLRASLLFSFFPLFGEGFVPIRIRIVLAGILSMALAPVVPLGEENFPRTLPAMGVMVFSETLLAFSIGFIGRALFAVIQYSGQLAGEQMGFGIINAIDPTNSHQISVTAEMQYLLAILLFLTADVHHVVFRGFAVSFEALAPGAAVMTPGVAEFFLGMGRSIFALTIRFTMPVVITVFAINAGMAMIGRAVPQVNVFIESFPLRIIGGMFVLLLGLGIFARLWIEMFRGIEPLIADLLIRMRG